ncbi:MAG: HAD family hydrolase [Candidatus Competibacterales bacterium]
MADAVGRSPLTSASTPALTSPLAVESARALVIFDCDGVLVDSEILTSHLLAAAVSAAGWPTTPAQSRARFLGRSMDCVVSMVEAHTGRPLPLPWLAAFEAERDAAFRRQLRPVPGVVALLQRLGARGYPLCVASSGSLAKMRLTLGLTGLAPYFGDRLYSAQQVPRAKPHPDVFLYAARQMGVAPERCWVVEDSLNGVRAAVAAGMAVWAYVPEGDGADHARAGGRVFAAMADLSRAWGLALN